MQPGFVDLLKEHLYIHVVQTVQMEDLIKRERQSYNKLSNPYTRYMAEHTYFPTITSIITFL